MWQFDRPPRSAATTTYPKTAPNKILHYGNLPSIPWMPRVENLGKGTNMGLLLTGCITTAAPIKELAID